MFWGLPILFLLLFVIYIIIKCIPKPIDTSLPFKEYWGKTKYKIDKDQYGCYSVHKTYYRNGPIYDDVPLYGYTLAKNCVTNELVWYINDIDWKRNDLLKLKFDTYEEAESHLNEIKKMFASEKRSTVYEETV